MTIIKKRDAIRYITEDPFLPSPLEKGGKGQNELSPAIEKLRMAKPNLPRRPMR